MKIWKLFPFKTLRIPQTNEFCISRPLRSSIFLPYEFRYLHVSHIFEWGFEQVCNIFPETSRFYDKLNELVPTY